MKRRNSFCLWLVLLFVSFFSYAVAGDEHKTLAIGATAPDFSLPGVDGKTYNLSSFKDAKILVIIFTCNHCPTAQAYEGRMIQLAKDYEKKMVSVVAVMPNDPTSINVDELGYTEMGDSFEEMKIRAKERQFNFPYLYDGETETMSKAYGPSTTPHVFIFDQERKLRFQGRIDDVEKPSKTPHSFDTRNAIDALLNNKEIAVKTTKVFGCSIKWAEKSNWKQKSADEWYEFDKSPRPDVHVLATADESSYKQNKPMGDHPIIWTNEKFDRMIYIGVGHDASVCANAAYAILIRDAILWAASSVNN